MYGESIVTVTDCGFFGNAKVISSQKSTSISCTNIAGLLWLQITNLIFENYGAKFPFRRWYWTTKKPRVIWNPKFYLTLYGVPHLKPNLNQFNAICDFTLHLSKLVFIILVLRTYNSSGVSSSKYCSYFFLPCTNYVSRTFKAFSFNIPRNMR